MHMPWQSEAAFARNTETDWNSMLSPTKLKWWVRGTGRSRLKPCDKQYSILGAHDCVTTWTE